MAGIADKREKTTALDRELMFALYIRLNTYDAVSRRLEAEGMVNPLSGKRFSRNAIRVSLMNSIGYKEWWDKRLNDPKYPSEVTQEERDAAKKIVEERMPIQKQMIEAYKLRKESVLA